MRAFITWVDTKGNHRVELLQRTSLVGRHEHAQLRVAHETVSRRHAELTKEEESLIIKDLGSRNGTSTSRSKEKLTEPTPLQNGDKFVCGAIMFEVELLPDEPVEAKTTVLPQLPSQE